MEKKKTRHWRPYTKLTITESGFDKVPLARRAQAFEMNEGGWEAQTKLLEKYVHAS